MKGTRTVTIVCIAVLVFGMAASVLLTRRIDTLREGAALREVLWIPSATTIKRMSLGYDGLVADIYWTRVVQYFGGKHRAKAQQYELLKPLLDITTELDPKLIPAYEFGGVFLAQKPPQGAGDPKAAAELVEKGIRNNYSAWRLRYTLGFIYWFELDDKKKAAEAFEEGSRVPGVHPWMKTLAARMAQEGGDRDKARFLWTNILESTSDEMIKDTARTRLQALDIDQVVEQVQQRVDKYKELTGKNPTSFTQLVSDGWIRMIPRSPKGVPMEILNSHVQLADYQDYPFITLGKPQGY